MASNFFAKPFGLHPTPSACYPPPPPPERGTITGNITISPTTFNTTTPTVISGNVANSIYQTGVPLTSVWNTPGLTPMNPEDILNNTPFNVTLQSTGVTGFFAGSVKVTWPNGQVRTYPLSYTITP